jgi:hypothetical protein
MCEVLGNKRESSYVFLAIKGNTNLFSLID